jgi:phage-related minor tail protein
MAVSYKGLVIKFGGDTTELQGALREVSKQSKNTQADLREIDKALKFNPGNTDLLAQKVKALNSAYDETEQKLAAYKQALSQLEAKKQSGAKLTSEEERQYDSLKRAILQCENQLESYGKELADTKREAEASKTSLYQFGQTIEDNADKLEKAGKGVERGGLAISGGITAAATGLTALAESQEEAIQQNAQLETAFTQAGGTVEQASSVYASFYRILGEGDTATEASQNLIRLTQNEEELQKWTDIAAGAYATFGDALPLENLAETAQETAHTGAVTGSFADALNWSTASAEQWSQALSGNAGAQAAFNKAIGEGMTKEDAFNEALAACKTEQERATLVTEALSGVYGDAGKQFQETNKDLLASRDAQNELETSMREMGEAALPVKQMVSEIGTEILGKLTPALKSASDWFKSLSPEQQELVKNLALGALAFGGVATAAGKLMQSASDIGGVIKTVAGGFTDLGGKADGLSGKFGGLGGGWKSLTGLIAANPIGLGVAAVSAAVAGLTWFFTQTETGKQMWSDFTGWISEKWQGVCDFFSGAGDFFSDTWNNVTTGVENFKNDVSSKWEGFKSDASNAWENVKSTISEKAQGAADWVSEKWNNLKTNTQTAFGAVKSTVQNDLNTAKEAGSHAGSALQAALSGDWSTARSEAASAFGTIRDNISQKMDAAQSNAVRVADAIGNKLGFPGLGAKVNGVFNGVRDFMKNPIENAWNWIKDIPNKIMNAFGGIKISLPKIKMPHFNVQWNDIGGVVKLPSISVDWYARGGYFDRASIIGVGERGGEYVAPEKQLWDFIERAVNNAFNGGGQTGQQINVAVEVNATVSGNTDAYQTGQQIGLGIASKLKQRGVSVAT